MEDNDQPIILDEIMQELGITKYTARLAIASLNIKGTTPNYDRRRTEYPPGTLKRIRKWLEENN